MSQRSSSWKQRSPLWAEDLLQGYISSLHACSKDEETQCLIIEEAIKMINFFLLYVPDILDVTAKSSVSDTQPAILEAMITFFNLVNSLRKKVKNKFRATLLGDFLNFISKKSVGLQYRLEILKSINNLLENFAVSFLENLLSDDDFVKKLGSLLTTLIEAGDYEFQVCLIECFNRVVPKPYKADVLRKTDHSGFLKELLHPIRVNGSHFDADCRAVLNKLNEKNSTLSPRVYSFPAGSVKLDGKEVYKPQDDEYEEFWVDLNTGSERISLFIEPSFPQSQEGEGEWDMVSLWKNDVVRCDCKTSGKFWRVDIQLKSGAQIYGSKDPDDKTHLFVIQVSTDCLLEDALLETFGDSCVNHLKKQKVCHTSSPLSISIRSPQSVSKSPKDKCKTNSCQNVSKLQNSSHNLPPNDLSQSSHQSRSNAKASIPSEPMTTPAGSWVSCSSQKSSWYEVQEQAKKISAELDMNAQLEKETCKSATPMTGQSEKLKTNKCSVSASEMVKRKSATSTHKENTSLFSRKSSLKQSANTVPVKNLFSPLPDETTCHDKKNQHKALPKDSDQISETLSSLVSQDDENSCLRRSQRNRNKLEREKPTKEKKASASSYKKEEKNASQKTMSSKKQVAQDAPTDTNNLFKISGKNVENSTKEGVLQSRNSKTPPPSKSIKSHKKVKTPVVTVQEPKRTPNSKSEKRVSNMKQDSVVLSSIPAESDSRLKDVKNSKDKSKHSCELVQEPTISSVYEEKKRKASKHMSAKASDLTQSHLLNKSTISPGCISEEDFKRPNVPFRCDHSKKESRKNKGQKDMKKKNIDTTDKTAFTGVKLQDNHGISGLLRGQNVGKQNACKEQGTNEEIVDYSISKKQSQRHDNFNTSNAKISLKEDHLDGDQKSSKSVHEICISEQDQSVMKTQHAVDETSVGSSVSNNYSSRNKNKSKFQPPCKTPKDSKKLRQEDKGKDMEMDILPSQSKSRICDDDTLKPKQRKSDTTCKRKTNANNDQECANGFKLPKSKKDISHAQQDTSNVEPLKNGYDEGELTKSRSCDDVSSSNSGYLFIETGPTSNDSECNMINETQFDKVSQLSEDVQNSADKINSSLIIAPTGPTIEPDRNACSEGIKKKNVNVLGKIPESFGFENNELNASGDYNPHSLGPEILSNTESSYVFNKYGLKRNYSEDTEVQDSYTKDSPVKGCVETNNETQKQPSQSCLENAKDKAVKHLNQPDNGGGDGLKVSESPDGNRPGRLLRQLRERNKKISYKEWDMFDPNVDDITPKKPDGAKSSTAGDKRKLQKDQNAARNFETVSQEKVRQKKTFWTRKEIKTTVTTTSFTKMINNSCLSDPYNFEADCATTSTEAAPLVPFRSFSMNSSSTSLSGSAQKQSIQGIKKASHKIKSDKRKVEKESSQKMELGYSKMSASLTSYNSRKRPINKSQWKEDKRKKRANEVVDFQYSPNQRDCIKKKKTKDKTKSSMEFSLFSSQKSQHEASNVDSGLVFPPLEDSIPCTPYDEIASVASNDVLEASPKKAALSECSWTKPKTPMALQEKMRGKTYDKPMSRQLEHEAKMAQSDTDDEIGQAPLYQKLHYKQQRKTIQTPEKKKFFDRGETGITRSRSPGQADIDSGLRRSFENREDKVKKTVSSILTNSTKRLKDSSTKKTNRSLSFKSPSDHEKSSDTNFSDHEGRMATYGIEDCSSREDQTLSLEFPTLDKTENTLSRLKGSWKNLNKNKAMESPWNALTTKIDQQNQELEKLDSPDLHFDVTDAYFSGPVLNKRPTRSTLKRKYMGQYTSSSDHEDKSESDGNHMEKISLPKKALQIGSSSRRMKEWNFDKCTTPRTPKNKLFSNFTINDTSPSVAKLVAPEKKSAPKKASKQPHVASTSAFKPKRKSQRKLDLSPALSNEDQQNFPFTSIPSFNFISGYISSPEKMRESSQCLPMLDKELCVSPFTPLLVAIEDSPAIGLSHLSSLEVCENSEEQDLESLPYPTALLDTIKDDLNKSLIPAQSEGSSQDYFTQKSESSKSEPDLWQSMPGSCAGLRDFVTRKNMVKGPLPVTEFADSTQQTIKCITSKWTDEQRERVNAVKKFQRVTENILSCMSRNVKDLAECERAAASLWEQQVEKLRKHRHAQEKELSSLRNAHDELEGRLQKNAANKSAFRDIRATLAKDVESFKRKLEDKYMEHSLTAMKRCLETSFMFS